MSGTVRNWPLRQAAIDDAEALAATIAAAFTDVARRFGLDAGNCPGHPSLITAADIAAAVRRGTVFLAATGADIPGCVGLRPPVAGVATLEKLAVRPEARRLGLGRALVASALTLARQTGAAEIEAGIIADHHDLAAWYAALDFHAVRRTRFDHLPFAVLYLRRATA